MLPVKPEAQNKPAEKRRGGFQKGKSGNPGGRPKAVRAVMEAAQKHTAAAIKALASALTDDDVRARIAAAEALLDRGWGRPSQQLEHTGKDGGTLAIYFTPIPDGDT